jgi:hypothetical protein
MKRELGTFERALFITDQHAPFHIVNVLRLEYAPPPQILRQALKVLQNHHPFLSSRLLHETGKYYLASLIEPGLPFHFLPRWNNDHWFQVAEVELGKRMDVSTGPLFRCTYLFDSNNSRGDIIFSFCHSIVDAASVSQLMSELLTTCAAFMDQRTVTVYELPPTPPVESRFPASYRGLQLTMNMLGYAARQFADEVFYRLRTRGKRIPSLHMKPWHGRILSMQLSEELIEPFAQRARREGVTLNSALNAAMLLAVNRNLYAGQPVPMRTFTFADLRPYVKPPLSNDQLACYISMLRYTFSVSGGLDFWELARSLHEKFYSSFKSGDKFSAVVMAESLMKMVTRLKAFRMSATALNYNGAVPVQPNYEKIKVTGLHGFVSAYDLGPELSAQAQIFNGQLIWDFTYLDADMNQEEARGIIEEIKSILHTAVARSEPTKQSPS